MPWAATATQTLALSRPVSSSHATSFLLLGLSRSSLSQGSCSCPSAQRAPPLALPRGLSLVIQLSVPVPPLQEAFSGHPFAPRLPPVLAFSSSFTRPFFTAFVTMRNPLVHRVVSLCFFCTTPRENISSKILYESPETENSARSLSW